MRVGKHNNGYRAEPRSTSCQAGQAACVCGKTSAGRGSRGFCSQECRFWSKVQKGPSCWLWQAARHRRGDGVDTYGQVYYKGRPRRAHIVAWALAHGALPDGGLAVCHRCDTPLCVRPDHLFVGTAKENMQDAAQKGRLHIPRPGAQKVTPSDIAEIRRRVAAGDLYRVVAADFAISRTLVSDLIRGVARRYDAPLRPATQREVA